MCGFDFEPSGTAVPAQVAGDCKQDVCDGAGAVISQNHDPDVEDDGQPCTTDSCASGTPVHSPLPLGTSCGTNLVCDAAGNCIGCNTPNDCPGSDDECKTRTCTNGMCGVSFTAAGTAVSSQTAGDCQENVCDGQGTVVSADDDADVPGDGQQCTLDLCTNGAPSNPDAPAGAPCTENGGAVCNGTGTCVDCNAATDCPGTDDECQTRTCTAGACGLSFTASGTPISTQTPGDCKADVCNGSGAVVSQNLDTDLPADGNQCTNDVCTNGVPSNPDAPAGATCSQNGGTQCDGNGSCVECLAATDCPGNDTECQTRTCTNGTCGLSFTGAGTPVSNQVPGNCQVNVCNGSGTVVSQPDNTDLPVDGIECTLDVCTAGVPSNPPEAAGSACTQNGGSLCDGAGTCVECLSATDCPGADTQCQVRTCAGNVCGVSFMSNTTPCGDSTDTECTDPDLCDGAGTCAPNHANAGSACGDQGIECKVDDACDGNGLCTDGGDVTGGTPCTSNGVFCDGVEVCGAGACGSPGDPCSTPNVCDEAAAMCLPPTDVLWCFQDASGTFVTTPTLGTGTFAYGAGIGAPGNVGGNAGPVECAGATRAATGNDWLETDEASALAANACYIFTVATGAGPLTFEFDAQRSSTGPTNFAVQVKPTLVSTPVTVLTGTPMTSAFSANPMHTADLSTVPNLSNQAAAEIRICAWGASGASGTFRIDNVRLQGP